MTEEVVVVVVVGRGWGVFASLPLNLPQITAASLLDQRSSKRELRFGGVHNSGGWVRGNDAERLQEESCALTY